MPKPMERLFSVEQKYGAIEQIGKGTYGDVWLIVPLNMIETKTRVSATD
jgi:hypothetical protein